MNDPSGYGVALVTFQSDCLILKVNQEFPLKDEKELIFFIVFVPMEHPFHDAETNYAVIHVTKGLIVPLLLTSGDEAWHVNQF
jgi:hypothetical protein